MAKALAAAIILATSALSAAHAAQTTPTSAQPAAAAEVKVALDQARALPINGVVRGVVIGNPTIAGVSVQNERLLFITGRSYGSTNLIVVGDNNRPLFQGRITVIADEDNAVIMNKGGWMVRYDCTPECRRRPDISEDPQAFSQTNSQIGARGGN